MNVFHKTALESLKKSRARTAVTIVGVALSTALMTAVVTFGVSLLHYMANGAAAKYGGWHAAFWNADDAFARAQAANEAVSAVQSVQNIGWAALEGGEAADKPYLLVAGLDGEAFDALPLTLLSGRLPQNENELLLTGGAVSKGGLSVPLGETLSLTLGVRERDGEALSLDAPYQPGEGLNAKTVKAYRVVGVCQTPAFENENAPGYMVITRASAAPAAAGCAVYVTLKDPGQVVGYAAEAAGGRAYSLNHRVLRFMGLSGDGSDRLFTALLYAVGAIVTAIIMVGSIFLIYNAFHISLNERTHQFGILASVGATAAQLKGMVLFEGLCVGAVGIPLGLLAGVGSMGLALGVVAQNFRNILYTDVPLALVISLPAMAGAAALSLMTILISAYLPARKAARQPIMDCLRQTGEMKGEAKAVQTPPWVTRLYGLEGTLALKNFKRNRQRYQSIVLSLALSIVLFVAASAFVDDLGQAAQQAKAVTSYDVGFGAPTMTEDESAEWYQRLKAVTGVKESARQTVAEVACDAAADGLTADYWAAAGMSPSGDRARVTAVLQFLDDEAYQRLAKKLGFASGTAKGAEAPLIAVAKMNSASPEEDSPAHLRNLFTQPLTTLVLEPEASGRTVTLACLEFVPPDCPPFAGGYSPKPYTLNVIAPMSRMAALALDPSAVIVRGMTFLSDNPSQTTAAMQAMVEGAGFRHIYYLLNTAKAFEESRNYIFIANVFAYTFVAMITLIAAANVFNTISTNIKLRRRELAMLRSVGMGDRAFNRMMRFECAFYGARALAAGLPIALAASWLIYQGMFQGGADGLRYRWPWLSAAISVLGVLALIAVTMVYAVGKLKKESVIDALRDDMA